MTKTSSRRTRSRSCPRTFWSPLGTTISSPPRSSACRSTRRSCRISSRKWQLTMQSVGVFKDAFSAEVFLRHEQLGGQRAPAVDGRHGELLQPLGADPAQEGRQGRGQVQDLQMQVAIRSSRPITDYLLLLVNAEQNIC